MDQLPSGVVTVVPTWADAAAGRIAVSAAATASAIAARGKTCIVIPPELNRQEQRERLFDGAPKRLAIGLVAVMAGCDAAEFDRVYGTGRKERDRCRHRRKLRAALAANGYVGDD